MPSPSGTDLKVKPMLDGRALQARALGRLIRICFYVFCWNQINFMFI